MSISKFVYDSILNGAKKAGATSSIARRFASTGQQSFDQSRFLDKNVGAMIDRMISDAVKQSKMTTNVGSSTPTFVVKPVAKKSSPKRVVRKATGAINEFVSAKSKARKIKSDCGLWSKKL